MKQIRLLILALAIPLIAFAQDTRLEEKPPREFQFIGYSFTRMTSGNVSPTNDVLQGQVIGRLFGQNSTFTIPQTTWYFEQRFVPMFIYKPQILDDYATFRALFKIDYTWGDQAYGVGNNRGGAINGGQINLQTLMANVEIRPEDANWNVVIGMQRIFDNVRDPNINTLTTAQTSAYKLSYWGTQGVGISSYIDPSPSTKLRLGMFQLWENEISKDDDVILWMTDFLWHPSPLIEAGIDAWYVYDKGKGGGGISILGQGLNSALADYNGATRVKFPGVNQKYEGHIGWLGGHFAWNRDFLASRWWIDGFFMSNFGILDTVGSSNGKISDIFGFSANASVQYKYGMTANDKVSFEALYTSGDANGVADGTLSSVITGNVYGSPVGIYSNHRAFLLFPDPQVVNRYYSAVHDISNMGLGVTAGFLNFYKDFIPNKLYGKVGFAAALSNNSLKGGGNFMGSEINFEMKYNLKVFLTLGVHGAYMMTGDFYDSPLSTYTGEKPKDPWTFFTTLSWLMF